MAEVTGGCIQCITTVAGDATERQCGKIKITPDACTASSNICTRVCDKDCCNGDTKIGCKIGQRAMLSSGNSFRQQDAFQTFPKFAIAAVAVLVTLRM